MRRWQGDSIRLCLSLSLSLSSSLSLSTVSLSFSLSISLSLSFSLLYQQLPCESDDEEQDPLSDVETVVLLYVA